MMDHIIWDNTRHYEECICSPINSFSLPQLVFLRYACHCGLAH